jgi:hypothetical protein
LLQTLANCAPRQPHSYGHQDQPKDENDWKDEEKQDSNIRIAGVAPDLSRQHEEPYTAGDSRQYGSSHTQPVARQEIKYWPIIILEQSPYTSLKSRDDDDQRAAVTYYFVPTTVL